MVLASRMYIDIWYTYVFISGFFFRFFSYQSIHTYAETIFRFVSFFFLLLRSRLNIIFALYLMSPSEFYNGSNYYQYCIKRVPECQRRTDSENMHA